MKTTPRHHVFTRHSDVTHLRQGRAPQLCVRGVGTLVGGPDVFDSLAVAAPRPARLLGLDIMGPRRTASLQLASS